jgi:hypothetical protein
MLAIAARDLALQFISFDFFCSYSGRWFLAHWLFIIIWLQMCWLIFKWIGKFSSQFDKICKPIITTPLIWISYCFFYMRQITAHTIPFFPHATVITSRRWRRLAIACFSPILGRVFRTVIDWCSFLLPGMNLVILWHSNGQTSQNDKYGDFRSHRSLKKHKNNLLSSNARELYIFSRDS